VAHSVLKGLAERVGVLVSLEYRTVASLLGVPAAVNPLASSFVVYTVSIVLSF
jgi:hypothetical protein